MGLSWLRHQLKIVLFLFLFNVPLEKLTHMVWVIILHEYKSLSQKVCSRWNVVMQHYAVIASLIQFTLHRVKIPDFAIGKSPPYHYRPSSMFCGWCDTGVCSSFINSSPHIEPPIWRKNFDLSIQRTLFHSSLVQSLCALAHLSLLT